MCHFLKKRDNSVIYLIKYLLDVVCAWGQQCMNIPIVMMVTKGGEGKGLTRVSRTAYRYQYIRVCNVIGK